MSPIECTFDTWLGKFYIVSKITRRIIYFEWIPHLAGAQPIHAFEYIECKALHSNKTNKNVI